MLLLSALVASLLIFVQVPFAFARPVSNSARAMSICVGENLKLHVMTESEPSSKASVLLMIDSAVENSLLFHDLSMKVSPTGQVQIRGQVQMPIPIGTTELVEIEFRDGQGSGSFAVQPWLVQDRNKEDRPKFLVDFTVPSAGAEDFCYHFTCLRRCKSHGASKIDGFRVKECTPILILI